MADSIFSSLRATLDQAAIEHIAGALGIPEQTASRGTISSIATLLSGLTAKADDPGMLRGLLDAAPAGDVSWRQVASGMADPNSPLLATGKRLLASIFGGGEGTVVNALSRELGIGTGAISSLMAGISPMVMGFINSRMRQDHLNMTDLKDQLRRESGSLRSALPAGLRDTFWPTTETRVPPPATVPMASPERHSNWLPVLVLCLIGLGLIWLLGSHMRRPRGPVTPSGTASRAYEYNQPTGGYKQVTLPNGVKLNIPVGGAEDGLLSFIQDPNAQVNNTTWFNFDHLMFDNGTASLQPASQAQLNNVAGILAAYPNVRLEVAGFTDNVGSAASNMELARNRATAVTTALSNRGVSADRMTTEAYGEQHAAASNNTEMGRAQNRRVAMRVTQK